MNLDIIQIEGIQDTVTHAAAWVPLAIAGISALASLGKTIAGSLQKRNATERMDKYKRVKLENAYKNTPYYNAEARALADRNLGQAYGTMASVEKQRGGRYGANLSAAQNNFNKASLEQAANEQDAYINHTNKVAQDEVRIQTAKAAIDKDNVNALASLYGAGIQNQMSGATELASNIGQGLYQADEGGMFEDDGGEKFNLRMEKFNSRMEKRATRAAHRKWKQDNLS